MKDIGVEFSLKDVPDIVDVFYKWLRGVQLHTMIGSVDPDSRLFKNALRFGGWSHKLSNLLRKIP